MKYEAKISIIYLLGISLVATTLICIFLPAPYAMSVMGSLLNYVFKYLLVVSGLLSTILITIHFLGVVHILIIFSLGISSLTSWLYFYKKNKPSYWLFIPITVWVGVGAWSTFLGLAASV